MSTTTEHPVISLKEMTANDVPLQLQLWVWVKFTIFILGIFYAVSLFRVNVLGQTMKPIQQPTSNLEQPREIASNPPVQPRTQKGLGSPTAIERGLN